MSARQQAKDNPKVLQLRLFPESPIVAIIDASRFT
jgi:hypothetical protein